MSLSAHAPFTGVGLVETLLFEFEVELELEDEDFTELELELLAGLRGIPAPTLFSESKASCEVLAPYLAEGKHDVKRKSTAKSFIPIEYSLKN